jgi:hypothetical protein
MQAFNNLPDRRITSEPGDFPIHGKFPSVGVNILILPIYNY